MTGPQDPTRQWRPPPQRPLPPRRPLPPPVNHPPPPQRHPPPYQPPYQPPRQANPYPGGRYAPYVPPRPSYPPAYRPPPPGRYGAQSPHPRLPPSTVASQRKSNRTALIGLALLVAVAAAVVLAVGVSRLDLFGGKQLDVNQTEAAVRQILTNPTYGYGVENVGAISCNDGKNPSVRKGGTFSCVVAVNGTKRHVAVLITDDNGTYEVDRPR